MKLSDFDYDLPSNHIAQYPLEQRTSSRLMVLKRATGEWSHHTFSDLENQLYPGDLLVLNDSRVIPARLLGKKWTGGIVELLIERILDERHAIAHIGVNRPVKINQVIILENGTEVRITHRQEDLFHLEFLSDSSVFDVLKTIGHVPLPPYISRTDQAIDKERYQTIFSKHPGSIAAPTAGLHFDASLLERLQVKGIQIAFITLHVGAGTFQPIRQPHLLKHKMHSERITISPLVCDAIAQTKQQGHRVIAVGTTVVRSLETAALTGTCLPYQGETNIFIYPGFSFRVVDALITNFHLPKSTLLLLVSAFAGERLIRQAYQEAIQKNYRFFSYGDAMFIE